MEKALTFATIYLKPHARKSIGQFSGNELCLPVFLFKKLLRVISLDIPKRSSIFTDRNFIRN